MNKFNELRIIGTILGLCLLSIGILINHYCSLHIGERIIGLYTHHPLLSAMGSLILLYKIADYIFVIGNAFIELFEYISFKITGGKEEYS